MKMKRVIWTRSGFEIPDVGVTKEDTKSKLLPIIQADGLIARGLAKDIKATKPETKKGDKS